LFRCSGRAIPRYDRERGIGGHLARSCCSAGGAWA
jgi:hypothetical protein